MLSDAGCYKQWSDKVKDLPKNIHYFVSELVEDTSTEEEKDGGWDVADYILRIYLGRKKD